MTARPMEEERVSDIDLDALIITWERNPNLLGFRDAVLSCLRELKANRHLSAEVKGLREALKTISEDGLWDAANPNALKSIQGIARAAIAKAEGLDAERGTGASESEPVKCS